MTRITRASLTIVAALACCLALSSTAFAVPGDSGANATLLNDSFGSSLITTLVAGTGAGPGTAYYFKTELFPGQTLNATFTPGPHVVNLKALFFVSSTDVRSGTQVSTSLTTLKFTALSHGMYTVEVATSGRDDETTTPPGTFTVAPTMVPASPSPSPITKAQTALRLSGPASVTVKHTWKLSGSILPSAAPGKIFLTYWRTKSGRWQQYGRASAVITGGKYSSSIKPPTKGKWRVFASYGGAASYYKAPTVKLNFTVK